MNCNLISSFHCGLMFESVEAMNWTGSISISRIQGDTIPPGSGLIFIWKLGHNKRVPGLAKGCVLLEAAVVAPASTDYRYATDVPGDRDEI
jgi:hypothetical protein